MFGLTRREQRWKAEQAAAELLVGLAATAVQAGAQVAIAEAHADNEAKEQRMACYAMPTMEAEEFARWAADALKRAGWSVKIEMQCGPNACTIERGNIERYTQEELDVASKRGKEIAASLRVE